MIYTVTLNPSIDFIVKVADFQLGALNRSDDDMKQPGGKGINVSRVLSRLGKPSVATGFIGGFTGEFIEQGLRKENIVTRFVRVNEETRINIKLKTGTETEINGAGPRVIEQQLEELIEKIKELKENDYLVLAGSVPRTVPSDIYSQLMEIAQKSGAKVIVDTSGEPLLEAIERKPYLIKPNHHELGELFSNEVKTIDEAIPLAQRLLDKGVENIIVSFASKGALLMNKDLCIHATVPKGEVVNSVGAGDTVVASFLAYLEDTNDSLRAFQYAIAAGSATAFSNEFCTKEDIERLVLEIDLTPKKRG
ncbi:1-phosphofructokinase [Alkalihalobacterium elongatum]|uniref:1-phosphofructokinase n=1 Tax=Alkalihalobacterium elongatum TaxID=2675466 RepID=UPI001C1F86AA|nr:1-phosphofructokinase [Alkalihalobacterium elongatum]